MVKQSRVTCRYSPVYLDDYGHPVSVHSPAEVSWPMSVFSRHRVGYREGAVPWTPVMPPSFILLSGPFHLITSACPKYTND